jgi:hypothetical protein
MPSVVFTPAQISTIASYFAQKQFVEPNNVALAGIDQLKTAIANVATSISIGGGSVAYSVSFSPPLNALTTVQQAALLCYIVQEAMGVPLV